MPDDAPRTDVLAERLDGLGRRFDAVEVRLGGLATKDELIQLIRSRDELANARIDALTQDVRELTSAIATERAERQASAQKESAERQTAIQQVEERANRARAFALSAIALGVTIVGALIALITNLGGPPA